MTRPKNPPIPASAAMPGKLTARLDSSLNSAAPANHAGAALFGTARPYCGWTDEEDARLRQMHADGRTWVEATADLHRSYLSVTQRARALNLQKTRVVISPDASPADHEQPEFQLVDPAPTPMATTRVRRVEHLFGLTPAPVVLRRRVALGQGFSMLGGWR